MDIKNILIIIAAVVNTLLGVFVYFKNPKNKVNQWFSVFVASLVFWCISMMFFRATSNQEDARLWVLILYEAALLIPPTLMYFIFTLPDGRLEVNKYVRIFLWLPPVVMGILTASGGQIISSVNIVSGQEKQILWGPQYLVYNIYFVVYFSVLFFILFKKFLASSGITRVQTKFILLGTFIPSILANAANLLLPTFGNFNFNWLGQVMTLPMVVFIVYAILKHHLMSVKVISTEIFSILISLVLLVNALLSESPNDYIFNFSLFLAISILSVLLIRGVLKEVKTREKLAKLTEELQAANEDLKKLDKAKSEFISIASHQLRTPLSIIKGFVSMLLEGSYGEMPDKAKEVLQKIATSNERLSRLINDLLDLSRMEGGRMQFKWDFLDFGALVASLVDELGPQAQAKKLALRFSAQVPEKTFVRADEEKLRQVVMNLIDNAIKYTPSGSIDVKLVKASDNKMRLTIKDTGIGINKEEIGLLFGKFVRGKKTPRLWTEGAGLGLYVARKILEEHNGNVWAESEGEGKGSTFYLELPVC